MTCKVILLFYKNIKKDLHFISTTHRKNSAKFMTTEVDIFNKSVSAFKEKL